MENILLLNQVKIGNMMKQLLFVYAILLGSIVFCQKAEVQLSIDPVSADVGEILTITVKSNVQGEVEIDNLPSSFVHGYDVMNGMEQEMDAAGNVITFYFLSQTGAIGKPGKYSIGPAYIKKGNKVYKSNTVNIDVGEKTNMTGGTVTAEQLKEPAFGIIQTNKSSIYEGEAVFIAAKIYSHFEPTHIDGYRSYEAPGAIDKQPVGNSKRIVVDMERFKGENLYFFEYDKNVLFLPGTGKFKITPYTAKLNQGYKGFQFTSNHTIIDIKPLPANAPSDFIGGVGNFSIEQSIDRSALKQGDVFKLQLTISGTGNIHNILEPKLNLPKGFIVYGDPEIDEQFTYTMRGTEGKMQFTYNIQVNKAGDSDFPGTSISYFDPKKETYQTVSTESQLINVAENKNFIAESIEDENSNLEELDAAPSLRPSSKAIQNSNLFIGSVPFWIGVGTPLFTAFIFFIFTTRRKKFADKIESKEIAKRKEKEIEEGIEKVKSLVNSSDENAFYTQVELTLKNAFETKMKVTENRMLNKNEIYAFLDNHNEHSLRKKVEKLFFECDQFRFGIGSSTDSKNLLSEKLGEIINELNR